MTTFTFTTEELTASNIADTVKKISSDSSKRILVEELSIPMVHYLLNEGIVEACEEAPEWLVLTNYGECFTTYDPSNGCVSFPSDMLPSIS